MRSFSCMSFLSSSWYSDFLHWCLPWLWSSAAARWPVGDSKYFLNPLYRLHFFSGVPAQPSDHQEHMGSRAWVRDALERQIFWCFFHGKAGIEQTRAVNDDHRLAPHLTSLSTAIHSQRLGAKLWFQAPTSQDCVFTGTLPSSSCLLSLLLSIKVEKHLLGSPQSEFGSSLLFFRNNNLPGSLPSIILTFPLATLV